MASSGEQPRPAARTASRCVTARGTHSFEVTGYSLHRNMGAGHYVQSAAFDVGGYRWCVQFYPYQTNREGHQEYVAVYLYLLSQGAEVRAHYDFRLVDHATGSSRSFFYKTVPSVFNTMDATKNGQGRGPIKFIKRSELEASEYLRDDRLVIECDVTVIKKSQLLLEASDDKGPTPEVSGDFGKLLETGEGADVTFEVEGEAFPAHKIVLATRSPVFKVELYGLVGEANNQRMTIQDMHSAVFRALLHYVYTDSLPAMEDLDSDGNNDMIKYLLVAADQYAPERLKLICEGILSKGIDVQNVATTLALADQYNCKKLREACVGYINASNRMDDVVQGEEQQPMPLSRFLGIFVHMWQKVVECCKK